MSLFAGENEDLQKIMVKVQSLMAITIGLQQIQQTLNKDSAFTLVTLNGLKEWWNNLLAVGIGEQTILGDRTLRLSRASFAPGDIQTVYFWRDGQYYTTEMMRPET